MDREIGGYFQTEKNTGSEYHDRALALNSGRNCLRYLIRIHKIKSIWLPSWLCDSVIDTCRNERVDVHFYKIDMLTLMPKLEMEMNESDWLYIVNYFGILKKEDILAYKRQTPNLIVDNAQAFFADRIEEIDTLYTCRKFFGVTDGGYVYCEQTDAFTCLERDQSHDRLGFLYGRMEENASAFFRAYRANEEQIDRLPLMKMSLTTKNLLKGIDYKTVFRKRTDNFAILYSDLQKYNLINLPPISGAYMFPLMMKNGESIKKAMIERKIYVPTLWPNLLVDCNGDEVAYLLSRDTVILPCDQRYNANDMEYLRDTIKRIGSLQ